MCMPFRVRVHLKAVQARCRHIRIRIERAYASGSYHGGYLRIVKL